MTDARAVYIRNLIISRCGDVLPEAEIAEALSPVDDPEEMLPASIVLQIVEVLDRMSERLAGYEAKFAAAEPLPARLH